jgi:hypothetical protein
MNALPALVDFVEAVANMRFPPKVNARLQDLMDRNTNGQLATTEREELAALAAVSEEMSLIRGQAFVLLGRKPS